MKCVLAVLGVAVALVPSFVSADIGPPTDLAPRARGAGRIVVARVTDIRAHFASNRFGDEIILSTAVLEVEETLKGGPAAVIEVEVEGGTVGDLTMKVSDLPSLMPGDRAVFFLDADTRGQMQPHDRGRGILRLSRDDRVEESDVTLEELRATVQDALRGAR